MSPKEHILQELQVELDRWEAYLGSLSEAQSTAVSLPGGWSLKDVIAHLWAWQQVSNARFDAARQGGEPALPGWLAGEDPESDEHIDAFNARIYDDNAGRPWPVVQRDWREGFQRLLRTAGEIPDGDLLREDKYPWLKGYALLAVLEGTLNHHREHYTSLLEG